jgi:FkbM family methyltransferase
LLVSSGDIAVDIGANVGFHTLALSELVGNKGKVYAFEPNTENVRLLLLTKAREKLENIEILPFALSDSIGTAAFSTAIGSNGNFLPNDQATLVHPNCIVVPTILMDTLFTGSKIDFIKIDIEGAEYKAMQGAKKTIGKYKPTIISEFSMEMLSRVSGVRGGDYMKFMLDMGYQAITLGVSGPIAEFTEVAPFVEAWGHPLRIEDILFIDRARGIGVADIERIARTARTAP